MHSPNFPNPYSLSLFQSHTVTCALQASIERDRWDLMHTLLAAGADINLQCGQWGTALQAAIERG